MFGRDARRHWALDGTTTHLNHGSYGAVPRAVMQAAEARRHHVQSNPTQFVRTELPGLLREAAALLAAYLGGQADDVVFVDNATTGINAVLRSLVLLPGDEVVVTNHVYGAVLRTLEFVCQRAGARLVQTEIPFPLSDADTVRDRIVGSLSPRTRLVVVDHVTSPTALTLPIAAIAAAAAERDVPVLVDGAHGPGMQDVGLDALGEAGVCWYAGNCHKWLGAPPGCGFLWTRSDRQGTVRPTTISHFIADGYTAAFDWPGTKDFSAYLAVADAVAFRRSFGEDAIFEYCHALAVAGGEMLATAWGTELGTPASMTGFMTTVAFPVGGPATRETADRLWRTFNDEHEVVPSVVPFGGRLWVRGSAYIYNEVADFERLAEAGLKIANAG